MKKSQSRDTGPLKDWELIRRLYKACLLYTLPLSQQGYNTKNNRLQLKELQDAISEEYFEKPEVKRRPQKGHEGNLKPLANIKYSITPKQIHLNPHNKSLFISNPIPNTICEAFNTKLDAKGKKNIVWKAKQIITRLRY